MKMPEKVCVCIHTYIVTSISPHKYNSHQPGLIILTYITTIKNIKTGKTNNHKFQQLFVKGLKLFTYFYKMVKCGHHRQAK